MSFTPHNFSEGDILYASQLNETEAQVAYNEQGILHNAENISELTTKVNTNTSRINEIVALPEGSTILDAEIADGRVGDDGTVYSSIGDAIRGQNSKVKEELSELQDVAYNNLGFENKWEQGTINSANGRNSDSNTRLRTVNFMPIDFFITTKHTHGMFSVVCYNGSKEFLGTTGWGDPTSQEFNKNDIVTQYPLTKYLRFIWALSSTAIVDISDFDSYGIDILSTKNVFDKIELVENKTNESKKIIDSIMVDSGVFDASHSVPYGFSSSNGKNNQTATNFWNTGVYKLPIGTSTLESNYRLYKTALYNANGEFISTDTSSHNVLIISPDVKFVKIAFENTDIPFENREMLKLYFNGKTAVDGDKIKNGTIHKTTLDSELNDKIFGTSNFRMEKLLHPTRTDFVAHKGDEKYRPGNSIVAYETAGKKGFDILNVAKLRKSADGTWWAMHDSTVDGTTNGTGAIVELHDDYLKTLKVTYHPSYAEYNISDFTDEELKIPTLEDAMKIASRYGMILMLRSDDFPYNYTEGSGKEKWDSVLEIIRKYRLTDVIFSINKQQAKVLRDNIGWMGEINYYAQNMSAEAAIGELTDGTINNTDNFSIMLDIAYINTEAIHTMHNAGFKFMTASTSHLSEAQVKELVENGCDYIQDMNRCYV